MTPVKSNAYADMLGELIDEAPKAVFAAIAVLALTDDGSQLSAARARVSLAWVVLFERGIVAQRPSRAARLLAAQERMKRGSP